MKNIKQIIRGCLDNDRKSQFALYEHVFDIMMSICKRYCKDDDLAMETLNMAFIKVLKNLDQYDPDLPLGPWVSRISVNEAIDAYRKRVRKREFIDDNNGALENYGEVYASPVNGNWEETEYLSSLLDFLKESEKLVFSMYAVDGFSHKEIADTLGITERSSIRHLTNARRKLQEIILNREAAKEKRELDR